MTNKISILIVDDSEFKIRNITQAIYEVLDTSRLDLTVARTATDATRAMKGLKFDLVVLDLLLPMRPGEPATPSGGMKLVANVRRDKQLLTPLHIIALSEDANAINLSTAALDADLIHTVRYSASESTWAVALQTKITQVANSASCAPTSSGSPHFLCDIAIVCALHKIELEAVRELPLVWEAVEPHLEGFVYRGSLHRPDSRPLSVIAAAQTEMGMSAAATLTANLISNYRPRWVLMAGIAAGVSGNFGDVIAADCCWDYGSGKIKGTSSKNIFLPAPSQIQIEPAMKSKLARFSLETSHMTAIRDRWKQRQAGGRVPKLQIGPVASGAAVVANRGVIQEVVSWNRKVVGLEMETYGMYFAARAAGAPKPLFLSAKSICDFGSIDKTDKHQAFAAFTSAQFLFEFIQSQFDAD